MRLTSVLLVLMITFVIIGSYTFYFIHQHHKPTLKKSSVFPNEELKIKNRFSKKPTKQIKSFDITRISNNEPIQINETQLIKFNMKYLKKLNKKLKLFVQIKKSPVKKNEKGLFTKRSLVKGDHILYVTGVVQSFEEIDRYNSFHTNSILNQISTLDNRFYIIPKKQDFWSFINHKDERYRNAEFVELYYDFQNKGHRELSKSNAKRGTQVLVVRASKAIKEGEEIFVDYGEDYDYEEAKFERFSK
jgi:hypothetical protein